MAEEKLNHKEKKFADSFITCPHCGSQLCYHQSLRSGVEAMTCMACGFTTSNLMKDGSETEQNVAKQYPRLYKDLRFVDALGYVWYPAVVTVPGIGMVYIDGSDSEKWEWVSTPMRKLTRKERRSGKFGNQEYIAIPEQTKRFGKEQGFIQACASINLFNQDDEN